MQASQSAELQNMDVNVFAVSIFTVFLLFSSSFFSGAQSKTSHGKFKEDNKLLLRKRSIYMNPLLVYRCSLPLGLENGQVPDAAFTALSSRDAKHSPARARLNIQADSNGTGAWSANASDRKQWLQIDFGELVRVTKVAIQGRQDADQWVKKFSLSYSMDGVYWAEYKESSVTWVFLGNKDRNTIVEHLLETEFYARFIRFHPKSWHEHVAMRAEVYGCRNVHSCSVSLGVEDKRIPDSAFTASSSVDRNHRPSLGRLNMLNNGSDVGAWCPKIKSVNQWLQINLDGITAVTKVATQGRYNSEDRVKTYKLSYSVDGTHWILYKQHGVDKIFAGNTDRNTVVTHSLKPHIEAGFIRFYPQTHNHNAPCMRTELYGCRNVKSCVMPVGIEDGRIPDEAFTASTFINGSDSYLPERARLNLLPNGRQYCWAVKENNVNQWLQVHLFRTFNIRGVATQGAMDSAGLHYWVTSFAVAYTIDDFNWVYIRESSKVKTFLGNSDETTVVKHFFSPDTGIFARSIRFHPKAWYNHILMRVEIYGCEDTRSCLIPLGMESGHLPDSAISASSIAGSSYIPKFSRLNNIAGDGAWCAASNNGNQWLQVYFGRETTVTKVTTQGTYTGNYWVTSYSLSFSVDGTHWAWYRLTDGHIKVFGGNINRNAPVYQSLHPPIQSKYLRFHPKTWSSHICMRAEVYGCQEDNYCSMSLGMEDGRIQDSAISASSDSGSGYDANFGRLNLVASSSRHGCWAAGSSDNKQWLQIDLGTFTTITKVATQGRQDSAQWVTSYSISYSINNSYWAHYSVDGEKKIFRGNFDQDSIVVHQIFPAFHARFVRIHPLTWNGYVSMRAELYGCPIRGI